MPRFLIERKLPGIGELNTRQLRSIVQKSNAALNDMRNSGTAIQWDHTYVSQDTMNCVYLAPDAEAIREHARNSGFPCDDIKEVGTIISPTTGE